MHSLTSSLVVPCDTCCTAFDISAGCPVEFFRRSSSALSGLEFDLREALSLASLPLSPRVFAVVLNDGSANDGDGTIQGYGMVVFNRGPRASISAVRTAIRAATPFEDLELPSTSLLYSQWVEQQQQQQRVLRASKQDVQSFKRLLQNNQVTLRKEMFPSAVVI